MSFEARAAAFQRFFQVRSARPAKPAKLRPLLQWCRQSRASLQKGRTPLLCCVP